METVLRVVALLLCGAVLDRLGWYSVPVLTVAFFALLFAGNEASKWISDSHLR